MTKANPATTIAPTTPPVTPPAMAGILDWIFVGAGDDGVSGGGVEVDGSSDSVGEAVGEALALGSTPEAERVDDGSWVNVQV